MRGKAMRRLLVALMAVLAVATHAGVALATVDYTFDAAKTYAIQQVGTNKLVRVVDNAVMVDGEPGTDTDSYDKATLFKVVYAERTDRDGEKTVGFVPLVSTGNALTTGRALAEKVYINSGGGDLDFHITGDGNQGYTIKGANGVYPFGEDIRFMFVEATYQDTDVVLLKNVGTGTYVTFTAEQGEDVLLGEEGPGAQFDAVFTNYNVNVSDAVSVGLKSRLKDGWVIISAYYDGGQVDRVMAKQTGAGGWECVMVEGVGNGKYALRSSANGVYITAEGGKLALTDKAKADLTDNEKFEITYRKAPTAVNDLKAEESKLTDDSVTLSWTNPKDCIYSDIEVYQKGPSDANYTKVADLTSQDSYVASGLARDTTYSFKLRLVNGSDAYATESNEIEATTLALTKPAVPTNVRVEKAGDKFKVSWDTVEGATGYRVEGAVSRYADYKEVAKTGAVTSAEVNAVDAADQYKNYFRVRALNGDGSHEVAGDPSAVDALEMRLFGDHTLVLAPTDDVSTVDALIEELFGKQNDRGADAQFRSEHWQIFFKPGDYTEFSRINLGFYTSLNGLGKLPADTRLNNISIPAYLEDNNATCNFWRSAENVSIIATGNDQGKAGYGSYRPDQLNWAVAQAAPLRRILSARPLAYDWNYGWASGGYVADSQVTGTFEDNGNSLSAGTSSGQQFYTRNSKMAGGVFGTTLNGFYQGVVAPNLPGQGDAATELYGGQGYSNWAKPGAQAQDGSDYDQQVVTNVTATKVIREKPFVYLDGDAYKVFVPALRKDAVGTSWDESSMGEGKSLSLTDDFYIAYPSDTAATINAALNGGKSVYFTPGVYHVDTPLLVTHDNTVLLGSGMATIVPDNADTAVRVGDVEGVTVAGLIFDAGTQNSRYLLQVGTNQSAGKADNPTLLCDLFFRIGGTTDASTSAVDALEINSNYVIGDHFWIWRADHGAGVSWDGNAAQHGLIVNGDDVTVYALFNEHFENYTTLWNGERGATYFYQNETAYDAITQDPSNEKAWLSHAGSVNGYASYKVSNNVREHYAVGLGIYNVFIYTGGGSFTGERYDGGAQIKLENGIEVPNAPGVVVENACLQSFANAGETGGLFEETQHIINGVGYGVSQGYLREETRNEEGALVGNLLDAEGNVLPTKVFYTKSQNEHGKDVFEYKVYELDEEGKPIVYKSAGVEYDLDNLPAGITYRLDDGSFALYSNGNWVHPNDYHGILATRSQPKSRAVTGKGWARTFLIRYQDGKATIGKEQTTPNLYGKYVGLETLEGVRQLGDDDLDLSALEAMHVKAVEASAKTNTYTQESLANLADAMALAASRLSMEGRKYETQVEVDEALSGLTNAVDALKLVTQTDTSQGGDDSGKGAGTGKSDGTGKDAGAGKSDETAGGNGAKPDAKPNDGGDATSKTYAVLEGDKGVWTRLVRDGAYVSGSSDSLRFRCEGALEQFQGIMVDGELVDAAHYTTASGSTIVNLGESFLKGLSAGKHDIVFVYDDGQGSATFTVRESEQKDNAGAEAAEGQKTPSTGGTATTGGTAATGAASGAKLAHTGDATSVLWAVMGAVVGIVAAAAGVALRSRRS